MQSIPFSTTNALFVTLFAKHNEEFFAVELLFDVSAIVDAPPSADGSPQFTVMPYCGRTITPAISNNIESTFPYQLPTRLSAKAKSSLDGNTYEIGCELIILNLQFVDNIDASNGMPEVSFQLSLNPVPIKQVTYHTLEAPETFNIFLCNYCGYYHPTSWDTKEHIIPEALKNKSYGLNQTCRRVNNYMAKSFETRILGLTPIKVALLLIDPKNEPVFIGEFDHPTAESVQHFLWPLGESEFAKLPEITQTDILPITVKTESGELSIYNLKLPFSVPISISGVPRMLKDKQKRISKATTKIDQYLTQLSKDPAVNREFYEFLLSVGGSFTYKGMAFNEVEQVGLPQIIGTHHVEIENEIIFKLFLKIAWTHAAKQLGRDRLMNPASNWIIEYLTSGYIIDVDLVSKYRDLFTPPSTIEGKIYIFWKSSIDKTRAKIESLSIPDADLIRHYNYRAQRFDFASQFITFQSVQAIDDVYKKHIQENRLHTLSLKTMEMSGESVTVCQISLFGGFLNAVVKLSEEPLADTYPEDYRINY